MTLLRAALAVLAIAFAVPATALAADRLVARDEPVGAARMSAPRPAPRDFDLVGLHWKGPGTVSFRTLSSAGTWSRWHAAAPEAEDSPDLSSRERMAGRGWKLGSPYWTGRSTAIRYRVEGRVTRLRAFFVWSDPSKESVGAHAPFVARAPQPAIIRRSGWGADESIVRAQPSYASAVDFAVVHHTAGTNSYSASESAAIVRGIQRYHVLANGWNDIGYNFLVDKYGQIFEGRGGGISKNVVGAHAQGFNTGSTGVAILGNYESTKISAAARAALVKLLAWRLDVAHVNPLGRLTWISGGNPEYPAGTKVNLRTISGHRDTGPTSCPGSSLYAQLPGIAADVAATGLPKLYAPAVTGGLGGPVRFTATLTSSLPWTVTIYDDSGAPVANGSGADTAVDWTWDASATPFGDYTYSISAGPDLRPAQGKIPGPPPLAVTSLKVRPGRLDAERRRHRREDNGLVLALDPRHRRGRRARLVGAGGPVARLRAGISERLPELRVERARLGREALARRRVPRSRDGDLAGAGCEQEPPPRRRPDARAPHGRPPELLSELRRPPRHVDARVSARPSGRCSRPDHARLDRGRDPAPARHARRGAGRVRVDRESERRGPRS